MIYRFSVDASVCFDIVANSEAEAQELARQYVTHEQQECFEIRDARNTCVYPGNVAENLALFCEYPEEEAATSYTLAENSAAI